VSQIVLMVIVCAVVGLAVVNHRPPSLRQGGAG